MFDELKDGWKNQPTHNLPNIEELKTSIGQDRKSLRCKLTVGIAALALTILTGIILWVVIPFTFLSTKIAFALMAVAIAGGIAYMLYLQHLLPSTIDNSKPGQVFTKDWIAYRKKTKLYAGKFMAVYSILLTIGLGLYLFEVTDDNPTLRFIAYVSTGGWILFVWLFMTPYYKRKTEERIDRVIANYEKIQEQF